MIDLEGLEKLLAEHNANMACVQTARDQGHRLPTEDEWKMRDRQDRLRSAAVNALPELIAMARDIAKLQEPDGVLVNMLRGTVPKVPAHSLHKLYTEDELLDAARAVLRARIAATDDSTALKEKPQ